MEGRFLKENFVERFLDLLTSSFGQNEVLSFRNIKSRSHQKAKHTVVRKTSLVAKLKSCDCGMFEVHAPFN
ncbi:hypothetical protein MKW98_028372 [Papaver atlanticum]|uniref:Uncharacterized protein n=1 Tax=Papaver atlanticum TaxID=357466 RepID=A0AAD4SW96_9MAGN|nr:hypothetical protein MKW98_028372 [Papaver atlanticum]